MGMAYINADNIREKVAEVVTDVPPGRRTWKREKGRSV